MNDLELMLQTIGDLEFARRKLMLRIIELEKEVEQLNTNRDSKDSEAQHPE